MAQLFNIKRIGNLIYRDLLLLKGTIFTAVAVAGVLFFMGFLYSLRWDYTISADEFVTLFSILYFLLGLVFTFSIFKEIHNQKQNPFYLSLPVSSLERLAATWLVTSILYTIFISIFAFLIAQLALLVGAMFTESRLHLVSITAEGYWIVVQIYLIIQPVFLLGAISFNRNRLVKTLLVISMVIFALLIFNIILCFIFNQGAFDVFTSDTLNSSAFTMAQNDFSLFGKWFFGIVFGPMMLVATYFRLTEKEM